MRRVVLTLAILAAVGLVTQSAQAWPGQYPYRGQPAYGGYGAYGSYGIHYYPYRPPVRAYGYPGHYGGYPSQHVLSFEASAARIMAKHSTYRYRTHPRSLLNAAPPSYYRRGW